METVSRRAFTRDLLGVHANGLASDRSVQGWGAKRWEPPALASQKLSGRIQLQPPLAGQGIACKGRLPRCCCSLATAPSPGY